jgi:hypothetical protein
MPEMRAYGQSWPPPIEYHFIDLSGEWQARRLAPVRVFFAAPAPAPEAPREWLMEAFDYDLQTIVVMPMDRLIPARRMPKGGA